MCYNFDLLFEQYNYCAGAVLYNNEIDPNNPGFWGNDASVEEILHTINSQNINNSDSVNNVF